MPEEHAALRPPSRLPLPAPALRTALAWSGAAAFPVALCFTVYDSQNYPTGLQFLLPALLAVLPVGLLLRRPLPALLAVLAGTFAAGTTVPGRWVEFPRGHPMTPIVLESEWGAYSLLVSGAVAVGIIAATRPLRAAAGAAVAVFAVQAGTAPYYTSGTNHYTIILVLFALVLLVAGGAGYSVRERRRHAAALGAQAAAQAVTAERLRIARELHDMVAHSIGIIAIQAGVGSRVIDTQPQEARNALTAIETTSRDTLSGLRRMLGALRQAGPVGLPQEPGASAPPLDPAPGLGDLDRLAATTSAAGVRVDVEWVGERLPLPAELDLSAYRIVQEAVTNVVRHARTRSCRVTVTQRDEEIAVEVVDDGPGGGRTPGTGYGLAGMRERVALLHGEFSAGARPGGGFRVAARLPLPSGSAARATAAGR
ncbi:sensor histidine kinase [Streptomyces sp. NPDC058657]|uniref:sensor histidine kinase n=1 Tax=unclassified Streptomyces TaxID=2593676 RepID=UPI0036626E4A